MRTPRGWLMECGRGSLIVALLLTVLGIKAAGCDMLEIIYPSESFTLKEGDTLTLNCTVRHPLNQSSDLKVYWCKHVDDQRGCTTVVKELEHLPSTGHSRPQAGIILSMQLHNVNQSDSGSYQCRASESGATAVGHYIRVKVIAEELNHVSSLNATGIQEAMSEGNKALRMGYWLEEIQALIMLLWMLVP